MKKVKNIFKFKFDNIENEIYLDSRNSYAKNDVENICKIFNLMIPNSLGNDDLEKYNFSNNYEPVVYYSLKELGINSQENIKLTKQLKENFSDMFSFIKNSLLYYYEERKTLYKYEDLLNEVFPDLSSKVYINYIDYLVEKTNNFDYLNIGELISFITGINFNYFKLTKFNNDYIKDTFLDEHYKNKKLSYLTKSKAINDISNIYYYKFDKENKKFIINESYFYKVIKALYDMSNRISILLKETETIKNINHNNIIYNNKIINNKDTVSLCLNINATILKEDYDISNTYQKLSLNSHKFLNIDCITIYFIIELLINNRIDNIINIINNESYYYNFERFIELVINLISYNLMSYKTFFDTNILDYDISSCRVYSNKIYFRLNDINKQLNFSLNDYYSTKLLQLYSFNNINKEYFNYYELNEETFNKFIIDKFNSFNICNIIKSIFDNINVRKKIYNYIKNYYEFLNYFSYRNVNKLKKEEKEKYEENKELIIMKFIEIKENNNNIKINFSKNNKLSSYIFQIEYLYDLLDYENSKLEKTNLFLKANFRKGLTDEEFNSNNLINVYNSKDFSYIYSLLSSKNIYNNNYNYYLNDIIYESLIENLFGDLDYYNRQTDEIKNIITKVGLSYLSFERETDNIIKINNFKYFDVREQKLSNGIKYRRIKDFNRIKLIATVLLKFGIEIFNPKYINKFNSLDDYNSFLNSYLKIFLKYISKNKYCIFSNNYYYFNINREYYLNFYNNIEKSVNNKEYLEQLLALIQFIFENVKNIPLKSKILIFDLLPNNLNLILVDKDYNNEKLIDYILNKKIKTYNLPLSKVIDIKSLLIDMLME